METKNKFVNKIIPNNKKFCIETWTDNEFKKKSVASKKINCFGELVLGFSSKCK